MADARWIPVVALLSAAVPASAQESRFQAELRREGEHVRESCGELHPKAVAGCGYALTTEDPFHVAFGNLPPQNGFGFGAAFVEHYTPNERWRLGWNVDGVRATSGSWRAGGYMKIIHTPDTPGIVVRAPGAPPLASTPAIRDYLVWNVYGQTMSLEELAFFGFGPTSLRSEKSFYSERQTIIGTSVIVPLTAPATLRGLRPSLVGALNGRFLHVRGHAFDSNPSIEQVHPNTPGLDEQPAFVQLEEGIRLKPSTAGGRLRLNYLIDFQQFLADSASRSSFHRWTLDLRHEIPLYRNVSSPGPRDTNGPDDCSTGPGSTGCPPLTFSRNREGTAMVRLLVTSSKASGGSAVPFYFQPTLGGSDINGAGLLSGYDDYRFRAPNLIALQEGVEHSLFSWPIGIWILAEQGNVALEPGDLGIRNLAHTFGVGFTLRAGGFPVITLSLTWSGTEGHRVLAAMDSSLLGGSTRPSLY